MFSLLLLLSLSHGTPTYSSGALHLDGSVSISHPREVIGDREYRYTFDDPDVLCQRFGQEHALDVQTKTALWGAYEAVHLDTRGDLSEPTFAETVAKRLICVSVRLLSM